jgi:Na+-driven multidrug efflux pump
MLIFSIVFWFWAPQVVRIFSSEADLVDIAGKFLKIQIVSYMMNGLMMVLMNCLNSYS